jgi:hypothetical protein
VGDGHTIRNLLGSYFACLSEVVQFMSETPEEAYHEEGDYCTDDDADEYAGWDFGGTG